MNFGLFGQPAGKYSFPYLLKFGHVMDSSFSQLSLCERIKKQVTPHLKALEERFTIRKEIGCGITLRMAKPSYLKKYHFYYNSSWVFHGRKFFQFYFFQTMGNKAFLRYITLSYLNCTRNGELFKFEVQKKFLKMVHFTT